MNGVSFLTCKLLKMIYIKKFRYTSHIAGPQWTCGKFLLCWTAQVFGSEVDLVSDGGIEGAEGYEVREEVGPTAGFCRPL